MSKALVIWLTGLPSAGKTSLAMGLHKLFVESCIPSVVIDGDVFRKSFCNDLGFSLKDRLENIRRAAEMAKIIINSDVFAICSFISPTIAIRNMAKKIIGGESFIEVFVSTPLSICQERDSKGLYRMAKEGKIENLTGISSPYEIPENPDIIVDTSHISKEEVTESLYLNLKQMYL